MTVILPVRLRQEIRSACSDIRLLCQGAEKVIVGQIPAFFPGCSGLAVTFLGDSLLRHRSQNISGWIEAVLVCACDGLRLWSAGTDTAEGLYARREIVAAIGVTDRGLNPRQGVRGYAPDQTGIELPVDRVIVVVGVIGSRRRGGIVPVRDNLPDSHAESFRIIRLGQIFSINVICRTDLAKTAETQPPIVHNRIPICEVLIVNYLIIRFCLAIPQNC